MSLRIFTVTIDLLLPAVPLVAGYLQSCVGLNRTYVRTVLSRNNFYNVKGLSFFHNGELTTTPEGQFLANGLLVAVSIPIPSMSDVEFGKDGRSNNKKSTYKIHQDELSDLYGSRADSLTIYPLLLINNCEFKENEEKFGLVPAEANLAGEDQLIISTNEVSPGNYEKGLGVAFALVLLNNLRGLCCLANYLHHSSIRRYGDRFADFAKFLTASLSPSSARIAEFLTMVFLPLRYDMVQAYGRLVHFLCHQSRTVVDAGLREFAGGVTRIKHAQNQQPLSNEPYGSSWHWNYRSFRTITSRQLAATWGETHVAAAAA